MQYFSSPSSSPRKYILILTALTSIIAGFILLFVETKSKSVDTTQVITSESEQKEAPKEDPYLYTRAANASPLTGLPCENYNKRPYALMYSGDLDAREYFTNMSKADVVVEMAHRLHGQPRLMGIFQCEEPIQVGPMRSGRVDHLSVAGSFDSVYVPWGKSTFAGSLLSEGVIDSMNCDSIPHGEGGPCFLDWDVDIWTANPAFSNVQELRKLGEERGFRSEYQGTPYKHQGDARPEDRPESGTVRVEYQSPYEADFKYDKETNSYLRFVNNEPDIDYATKEQIRVKNVVVIPTEKDGFRLAIPYSALGLRDPWATVPLEKQENLDNQYPNMALGDPWYDTKFEGEAFIYFNGQEIQGTWRREKGIDNPYTFYDESGEEVEFVAGKTWIAVPESIRPIYFNGQERGPGYVPPVGTGTANTLPQDTTQTPIIVDKEL